MRPEDEIIVLLDDEDSERLRREAVARRAYELYLARGGGHGRDVEDWLRAERHVEERGVH